MSEAVAAPTDQAVNVINTVLDILIQGFGEKAAIAAAQTQAPFLAWPVISQIFTWAVSKIAADLDTNLAKYVDVIVIRFQNDANKEVYDEAINKLKVSPGDPQSLQDARNAINNLVNRNKP